MGFLGGLEVAFLGAFGTYASAIIVIVLVVVLLGSARGWLSGIGSMWGIVAVAAFLVLLGLYALWAGMQVLGLALVVLGILVLAMDALAAAGRGRRSGRVKA